MADGRSQHTSFPSFSTSGGSFFLLASLCTHVCVGCYFCCMAKAAAAEYSFSSGYILKQVHVLSLSSLLFSHKHTYTQQSSYTMFIYIPFAFPQLVMQFFLFDIYTCIDILSANHFNKITGYSNFFFFLN